MGKDAGVHAERRIGAIDGLRATAFMLVFLFHTWEFAGRPTVPLVTAVVAQNTRPDFFVVLTGFVLFMPLARDSKRLGTFHVPGYVRRRLRRIVLPYYAALAFAVLLPQALVALMKVLGRKADWQPVPGVWDWITHLTFTHLFSVEHWDGINGSLWTMALEMQLYLLFPLLVVGYARWGVRALGVALAISFGYRLIAGLAVAGQGFPVEFLVAANGVGRLQEMIAGMLAAIVVFGSRRTIGRRALALIGGGIVLAYGLAVSPLGANSYLSLREIFLGVTVALVIVLALRTRSLGRFLGSTPIRWTGYRAYSLFLIHQPLMWYFSEMVTKLLGVPNGPAKLALLWTAGLAVTVLVGVVFFEVVERPCLAWAKRVPTSVSWRSCSADLQSNHGTARFPRTVCEERHSRAWNSV